MSTQRHYSKPPIVEAILDSLDAISLLPHGWDSYAAPAPSIVAVQNAKALVNEADRFGMLPIRVEPSAMGGVGVRFSNGDREVVVEFYNQGSAHALFADDVTGDMRTKPVSTDLAGYQRFLSEVRAYLEFTHVRPQVDAGETGFKVTCR